MKLADWLHNTTAIALQSYIRESYPNSQSWKSKEAALYLMNVLVGWATAESFDTEVFLEFAKHGMSEPDEFLRARGFLAAGGLVRAGMENNGTAGKQYLEQTLQTLVKDESEVVRVACVRALQNYLEQPPVPGAVEMQGAIIQALEQYVESQDLHEQRDSDDFACTEALCGEHLIRDTGFKFSLCVSPKISIN